MSDQTKATALPIRRGPDFIIILERFGVLVFLALLVAFFASQNIRFVSPRNITNILTEVSVYVILGVGMTFVILTGGVDLAIGSLLAFCAMCGAYVVMALGGDFTGSWLVALVIACAIGLIAGYLQGKTATAFRIPPFIVTLGGLTIWRGATLIINDGGPISGFNAGYRWWGEAMSPASRSPCW